MIIPNVFGPFGRPYYNSVVATFCHQLTHGETPEIHVDGDLKLIYINELVDEFYQQIKNAEDGRIIRYSVPHTSERKVSEILNILTNFREDYLEKGVMPNLGKPFELSLFNTYRCYIDHDHYPFRYVKHTDDRGSFVEIMRANTSGQFSYSTTKPGITRGNHYHTRKAERFAVISGKARIQLRKIGTSEIIEYELDGDEPSFVDMPIWFTHNIINIGEEELITLFWINEPYDPDDPDTYYENV
jgi:UDP-2-acetamido-2,6-beta-L-arabino-hexul-4-ose reductase